MGVGMKSTRWIIGLAILLLIGFAPSSCRKSSPQVGSKKFTESVILGEIIRLIAHDAGLVMDHQQELGGTQIIFKALENGDIVIYPEYTGTLIHEILREPDINSIDEIRAALAKRDIEMLGPLGFNNSYGLGLKRQRAEELGIKSISDLNRYPQLVFRFGNEFLQRKDGWQPLKQAYQLPHRDVKGMDHDLAYREIDSGPADIMDVYTTDAKIKYYDLVVLDDDRNFFPEYQAVILFRKEFGDKYPEVIQSLKRLEGALDHTRVMEINGESELLNRPEASVAREYLQKDHSIEFPDRDNSDSMYAQVKKRTLEHLDLVRLSLVPAILFGIPLGIIAFKSKWAGTVILGVVGIVQTIPGLALLVMLLPVAYAIGISGIGGGSAPVLVALFLYGLLPIVQNTVSGLQSVPLSLRESAQAIGLTRLNELIQIELPMASPTILAGVRTAAVINVGFATLGAIIGAGGFGQPILTGVRLANTSLILQGAIPAALMAIAFQFGFSLIEKLIVPRGLRLG
jgi:osmoprotectant transport system permease protein